MIASSGHKIIDFDLTNDNYLASCHVDDKIRIFHLDSKNVIAEFSGIFGDRILCVKFSPKKTYLAAGGVNTKIGLWAFGQWDEALKVLDGHETKIRCMTFSQDETTLVSGSKDGNILL